jgi:hypothetical protein
MKIAIILSGHLRSFRDTFPSFQNLKSTLQSIGRVDIYCHTWNIEESLTASWWKDHGAGTAPPANVNQSEVAGMYQPTAHLIEPSKYFSEPEINIKSTIPVSGLLSMLYSQYAAFKLMEENCARNNIEYDLVIKSRYDLIYEIAGDFSKYISNIKNGELSVPNSNSFELIGACSDVFAAGDYKSMSEYFRFYERFNEMMNSYVALHYRELIPELALRTYLDRFNVKHRVSEGIRFTILRANGSRFLVNSDKQFDFNLPNSFFKETVERNRKVLPENIQSFNENESRILFKYLKWVDDTATDERLKKYDDFYKGKWIGAGPVKELVMKCRQSKSLDRSVIKSFFETALRVSEYGLTLKLAFAFIMWQAGFGFYYFRIIKKLKQDRT